MSVLYIALPLAVAMGGLALWACIRCIRGGQFDDLETPPMRMLIDDSPRQVQEYQEVQSEQFNGEADS